MYYIDSKKVKYVKSEGYKCERNSFRFYLELGTFSSVDEVAIVIMKNPAKACLHNLYGAQNLTNLKIESDSTVNHVIDKLHNNYKKIIILNLYPYMASNTKIANNFLISYKNKRLCDYVKKRNFYTLQNVLKQNVTANIFCAWGKESSLNISMYAEDIYRLVSYCFRNHIKLGEYNRIMPSLWVPLRTFFPSHASKW